jgi:hypothetical protein
MVRRAIEETWETRDARDSAAGGRAESWIEVMTVPQGSLAFPAVNLSESVYRWDYDFQSRPSTNAYKDETYEKEYNR